MHRAPLCALGRRLTLKTISVLLVDDHILFRDGLTSLLKEYPDLQVVGSAEDGAQAIELARQWLPDLILMDVQMPRLNGLEATRKIKAEMPDVRIVMLTMSEDDKDLYEAIKSGAQPNRGTTRSQARARPSAARIHAAGRA